MKVSTWTALAVLAGGALLGGSAFAGPLGTWRLSDGSQIATIRQCGRNLCGSIDGAPVLNAMRATGKNVWSGSITNLVGGGVFDGTVTLIGDDQLQVHGCMRDSGMCGDQTWMRVKK